MASSLTRAFIAVEFPQDLRQALWQSAQDFRDTEADVKWAAPEHLHLTFKFLGELPKNILNTLPSLLEKAVAQQSPFTIDITHRGVFPPQGRPRIIWAGITHNTDRLSSLASGIDRALQPLNLRKDDHPFHAHVTLGRVRSPHHLSRLAETIKKTPDAFPLRHTVDALTLFKSTLTANGPIHEVLSRYPFPG